VELENEMAVLRDENNLLTIDVRMFGVCLAIYLPLMLLS
jgi:hypothetical protein